MSDPSLQRYVNAMLAVAKFHIGLTKMYLMAACGHMESSSALFANYEVPKCD